MSVSIVFILVSSPQVIGTDDSPLRTKLSLSYALSQSVKISLFEDLISTTIEDTKGIPEIISETGKIGMPHKGKAYSLMLFFFLLQLRNP